MVAGLDAATTHAAATLGIITHAANNHKVSEMVDGGALVTRTLRDSVDEPKRKRVAVPVPQTADPPVVPTASTSSKPHKEPKQTIPWRETRPTSAATVAKRVQADCLVQRVNEIGRSLRPSKSSGWLDTVKERILSRVASRVKPAE